jgi:hypothetical protein
MLITGERHLQMVLGNHADHYNTHRLHWVVEQAPAAPVLAAAATDQNKLAVVPIDARVQRRKSRAA